MKKQEVLKSTPFRSQPPGARGIILIILLAATGLLGSLIYLSHDVRTAGYRQQRWAIRDSATVKDTLIDTLHVIIHPAGYLQQFPAKAIKADVNWDIRDLYMTYNPTFLVWIFLISLMTALAFALSPIIIKTIADIYKIAGVDPISLAWAIDIAILIGIFITFTNKIPYVLQLFKLMQKGGVLLFHPPRLGVFIVICLLPGLAAITGQLVINYAVSKLPNDVFEASAEEKKHALAIFLQLRRGLKFFLAADAALIVLSVFTTDTLRRAILIEIQSTNQPKHELFPQEFVYLYGLVFTVYLAMLYIPVYYRLKFQGETMIGSLDPDNPEQVKLAANFIIQESALDSFKVALSILAPLVSSLLPGLISKI